MKYPYAGKNLFRDPPTYEYADCQSLAYMAAWRTARDATLSALRSTETTSIDTPGEAPQNGGIGLTEVLLAVSDDAVVGGLDMANSKQVIDALLQKFEIFRRLFASYQPDLRRALDAREANLDEYILFGETLAIVAERLRSPKYLSTLIKLVDALCSVPASDYGPSERERFASLIERERALVELWESEVADSA